MNNKNYIIFLYVAKLPQWWYMLMNNNKISNQTKMDELYDEHHY